MKTTSFSQKSIGKNKSLELFIFPNIIRKQNFRDVTVHCKIKFKKE